MGLDTRGAVDRESSSQWRRRQSHFGKSVSVNFTTTDSDLWSNSS